MKFEKEQASLIDSINFYEYEFRWNLSPVSGTFSIVEAAFTASTEYNKKSSLLKKNTKTIIRSEATCTIYEGRVQTGTPPKFTDNFLQSVKLLGEKPEYGRFLDTFGTHFVEAVDMGAR